MDNLSFLVTQIDGEKPKCILVTPRRSECVEAFKAAIKNSKLDRVVLYGNASATHMRSPSKVAEIVSENNKRLADEASAIANAEKNQAQADLETAEAKAKEAKAKLKELSSEE